MANSQEQGRLQNHFTSSSNNTASWDALWKDNFSPWDRGQPGPALFQLLDERKDLVGEAWTRDFSGNKRRKRALVPGCGRGYDVLLFASYGYDAWGLDGSDTAIEEARKVTENTFASVEERPGAHGKGEVGFVVGDFYTTEWQPKTGYAQGNKFDLIYDYTVRCLCRNVWLFVLTHDSSCAR